MFEVANMTKITCPRMQETEIQRDAGFGVAAITIFSLSAYCLFRNGTWLEFFLGCCLAFIAIMIAKIMEGDSNRGFRSSLVRINNLDLRRPTNYGNRN